jgi:dihydroorotase
MMRTRCCENSICDTERDYVMFSYSREHCSRSHSRYTLCGYYGTEASCDSTKDWRECKGCIIPESISGLPDKLWRGLNPYNFCPLLSKDVPRHSLCETCQKCRKKFMSGLEGSSYGPEGVTCIKCSGGPF